jgi:hypothetical protein
MKNAYRNSSATVTDKSSRMSSKGYLLLIDLVLLQEETFTKLTIFVEVKQRPFLTDLVLLQEET